jgi:hypothetical protein
VAIKRDATSTANFIFDLSSYLFRFGIIFVICTNPVILIMAMESLKFHPGPGHKSISEVARQQGVEG